MIFINSNNNQTVFKPLKDLNLINSFLFDTSMEDPENAKEIARIIIKRATGRELDNIVVETQKELKGIESGKRGIRMDVLVSVPDSENRINEVYDIEPNDYYEPDLAKRTRYYNSMVDVKLLKTRDTFGTLPELISIWILPYDPFGANRMIYTVKNVVTEDNKLVYNDGVTNLFLYTGGKIGGSKALADLLNHMTHTTKDNAVDPDLKQIQRIVDAIKSDRKVGERYMSMEKIYESAKQKYYNLGKEAGLDEGRKAGLNEGRKAGLDEGRKAGLDEGRKAGLDEGRKAGLNEGIKALIEAFMEDGATTEKIKATLLAKFNISEAEADEYITKYFK